MEIKKVGQRDIDYGRDDRSFFTLVQYLLRNPNTCFVAEDNGKIVGVIMSGHDGRRGFIHHTTVKKEYRGQGIGKKLVDAALAELEAEGIHKVALVAFEKNISGNIFWEKVGFTVRDAKVLHAMQEKQNYSGSSGLGLASGT